MARANKVVKYKLQKWIDPMLDDGYSVYDIQKVVREQHPEWLGKQESELLNFSHMSAERYKDYREKNKLIELSNTGTNVTEYLSRQLLVDTQEIMDGIKNLSKEANELLQESKKDGSYRDRVSVLKEFRENLNQQVKVLESRVQYGARQFQRNDDNNEKKIQTLNITLIQMADDLCEKCRKKILEKLKEKKK